jgi:hypothetical protein
MQYLRFQPMDSNAKLRKAMRKHVPTGKLLTFSIPAAWTCPAALDCESRADRDTGRITDGEHMQFRCFAATMEARRATVRESRWYNYELLKAAYQEDKTRGALVRLIRESLARHGDVALVRIHVSGDFYNQFYLQSWLDVVRDMPSTRFYAYTKSAIPTIAANMHNPEWATPNITFIASRGGRYDHLIDAHGLREARVVYSREEARALGLAIDDDDTLAAFGHTSFALLLHGTQPAGSVASKALSAIKLERIS